jgi:hypothetical protein
MTDNQVKKIMKSASNKTKQRELFLKAESKRDKEFCMIEDILDEYDEDYVSMSAYDRAMISRKELRGSEEEVIHTTVGVYSNLNAPFKSNGVKSERLDDHIKYNTDHRFGRALFVDGVCVYKGYLSDEDIELVQEKVSKIRHDVDTAPYV